MLWPVLTNTSVLPPQKKKKNIFIGIHELAEEEVGRGRDLSLAMVLWGLISTLSIFSTYWLICVASAAICSAEG